MANDEYWNQTQPSASGAAVGAQSTSGAPAGAQPASGVPTVPTGEQPASFVSSAGAQPSSFGSSTGTQSFTPTASVDMQSSTASTSADDGGSSHSAPPQPVNYQSQSAQSQPSYTQSQQPTQQFQQQPAYAQSQSQPQQPAYAQSQSQQSTAYAQPQSQQSTAYAQPQPAYAQPVYVQVPYQQPAAPQKKSHGWIVAIVMIVCLFIFTAFCVSMCSNSLASLGTYGGTSLDSLSGDAIAVIDIDGTIQYDGSACSPEGLKELLDEAEDNDHIKAVVLRVNSGGGTATAGEEMAEYVRQFAEVKPVVVSSASINASAAYEISSQADYIYVAKSTEIGAIGTAMELTDISGLLDMLGVNMEVITSSDEKDSSYGYRPLTDQERAEYQHMVDQINDVFVQNVADGRGMTIDEVRALATGMPFTGIDAVANGLADEIGTREDAIEKAATLSGATNYTTYSLSFSDYDLSSLAYLLGNSKSDISVDDLVELISNASTNGSHKIELR